MSTLSWIKWKEHIDESNLSNKTFGGNNQKIIQNEEINSQINYPRYGSLVRLSGKEGGIVSTSLKSSFKKYQVSIDRRESEVGPRPDAQSKKSSVENIEYCNRGVKSRTTSRGQKNAKKIGKILANTTIGSPSLCKYAKSRIICSLDIEFDKENRNHSQICSKRRSTIDMGMLEGNSHCELCAGGSYIEHDLLDKLSDENMRCTSSVDSSDCEVCRRIKSGNTGNGDEPIEEEYMYPVHEIAISEVDQVPSCCNKYCECCCISSTDGDMLPMEPPISSCRRSECCPNDSYKINSSFHYRNEKTNLSPNRISRRSPFGNLNKFFSRKYRKFRKRFRSRSLPPRNLFVSDEFPNSLVHLDNNMNEKCSICDRLEAEKDSDSQWEALLACSCKSKSLLDVDKLSLYVNPPPSPHNIRRIHSACECCQEIHSPLLIEDSETDEIWLENSSAVDHSQQEYVNEHDSFCESPFCEQCAQEAEQYDPCCQECDANFVRQTDSQELVSADIMTLADLKKYGGMTPKKVAIRQPKSTPYRSWRKHSRKSKVADISKSTLADRFFDNFALCFQCVYSKAGIGSSNSGGSGSDDEGDDEEPEPEEAYEEHGEAVSDDDDSDGGDSGSGSDDDESMNSAELYDDTANALDAKDVNNIEGSDDGGDPGSECTDSLTELGSDESDDESESSEDDIDSFLEAGFGGSGDNSLQSIIIYERE
uniref:uncharacterized protein LOC120339934 n=1 Tax=Styela clava TaxID=7725 RepID=UPI00193A4CD9|nr:uncharacterized protein LOC120339934 [Styela clava]